MSMPIGDIVPELILTVGPIVLLIAALFLPRRHQPALVWVSLGVLVAAGVAALRQLGMAESLTFFDTWAVDRAAVVGKLIVIASAAVVVAMTPQWFRSDPRAGEYQTMLLFATLGGVILASAADLMELTLGLLLSSVTGYVMTGYHRRSKESGEAAIKYYLLGALANATFLYGVLLLFGLSGSTTYPAVADGLAGADRLGVGAAVVLAAVGLAFKVGAVPVHPWVPDVAQGAPAPSAAFLLVIPKVGGVIAITRFALLLVDTGVGWRPLLALLAAATMTVGNLAALWQDDLRRLLGWSAVSQTGYALMAPVALGRSDLTVPSLLLFLAAYAAATLTAFGVVVALRGRTAIGDYAGLARARPWLYGALVLAFLSMVGIPPLAGFAGKLALFAATIDAGYTWLAVVAVVNSIASLFYYVRVIGPGYTEEPSGPVAMLGASAGVATGVAAAAVVAIGVVAQPLLSLLEGSVLLP
ncbi:MAG: NADH-quinone oxidoreductase subunit N [Candidatus Longimicrobiales bacterium M2_2A_002]|jgi:NADH-quinone oxidoreductase subunit N